LNSAPPDFRSPAFLRDHALWVMSFYDDRCVDPSGGMFHYYLDDGTVYDRTTRHLVSATRFVVTHATAYELSGDERYRQRAAHALAFLEQAFRDREQEGFHWIVRWDIFERPKIAPDYDTGILDTWWINAEKAKTLKRGN